MMLRLRIMEMGFYEFKLILITPVFQNLATMSSAMSEDQRKSMDDSAEEAERLHFQKVP